MQEFILFLIGSFVIAFLALFIPTMIYKRMTKTALPLSLQKTIAIVAGVIALLITLKKYFG